MVRVWITWSRLAFLDGISRLPMSDNRKSYPPYVVEFAGNGLYIELVGIADPDQCAKALRDIASDLERGILSRGGSR